MDKYHLYDNVECKTNEEIITYQTFESMQLKQELLRGIYDYGYTKPSLVQQRALVPIIQGRDVVIQSQRNTGKTTVIALSVLSVIDLSNKQTQVLILSKNKELAEYNMNIIIALSNYLNVSIYACSGVNSIQEDIIILQNGVQIISGTFDRVFDLIQRKQLIVDHLKMIILNQADEILIDKSSSQVYDFYQYLPSKTQNVVMTATLSQDILDFIEIFINNPLKIFSKRIEMTLEGIKQFFIQIDKEEWKFETLCDIYNTINITQSVIYCSTKQKCEWLVNKMIENQFTVVQMHENMNQQERNKIMTDFKQGYYRVLITSDILGRSLDIELISLIINYDIPKLKELYIHRIGRTGKFGRKSIVINFLIQEDIKILNEIEQYYQTKIEEMPINFTDFL